MARVSEIDEPGDDPVLARVFAAERDAMGDLMNPTKVMAHRPGILRAAKQLYAACAASGLMPAGLMSLVYARVATINGCPF